MKDKGNKRVLEELQDLFLSIKGIDPREIEDQFRKGLNRLRFSKPIEDLFTQYYLSKYIWQIRSALITGILLYGVFGALDSFIFPDSRVYMWLIRYLVVIPMGIFVLAMTFRIKEERIIHMIHSALIVVAGLGITAMVYLAIKNNKAFMYYGGLLLVVFYAYSLSGLRFYYAAFSSISITILYPIIDLAIIQTPKEQLIMNMFFLVSANLLGLPISYMLERQRRKDFLLTALLAVERSKTEELIEKLKAISYLDGLTGIPNRRHFEEKVNKEWVRSLRSGKPLSLLMADIDFFKRYNDSEGHLKGDECLKEVAKIIESVLRQHIDMVARYGGEEFVIVLPETSLDQAVSVAERVRRAVEDLKIPHPNSEVSDYITVSIGVTSIIPRRGLEISEIIKRADTALYRAKREGRNRVVVFVPDHKDRS